jgi:hypothetical protein
VARIASTVLVVALIAATAAAFALTQGLKLQPSPILGTRVDDVFSPVCGCERDTATISFRLREADRLDISIVDGAGTVVRTIERGHVYPRGRLTIRWDGRDDAGRVLPEEEFYARIHLRDERKTIRLPNPIRIDVTPPRLELVSAAPRVFSPDGDGRADRVTFRYRSDEPARGMLFVDGTRRVLTRFPREEETIVWNGRAEGRPLPVGPHRVRLAAFDPAGNVARPTEPVTVVLRYVSIGRARILVLPGQRFALRVSSDAERVRWRLGARRGVARPGTLRIRAPLQKGRFTLTVTAGAHSARAAVFVREPIR